MSLKEITADLHDLAEHTPFMKAVFASTLPILVWEEWTYWRTLFYKAIEEKCESANLLEDIKGIKRTNYLWQDYLEMRQGVYLPSGHANNPALQEYLDYIETITPQQALAHLYVWHMGDLYGGQMIKRVIPAPSHYALDFSNSDELKTNLRAKLSDSMGAEARTAFEHAIKMLNAIYQ
jgi:heme oxygenase